MVLESLADKAEEMQHEEDSSALEDDSAKMGEGANTQVFRSTRGYIVKPVLYSEAQAQNTCKKAEHPANHLDRVEELERFPWAELDKQNNEGHLDRAWVRMEPSHLTHEEAVAIYHIDDVIEGDLNMFFDLRQENITYGDFKPENIHYFSDPRFSNNGMDIAKPIDLTDGSRKPWREEEDLSLRKFADIIDVYITGTPDEDGLIDKYPISTPKAEENILNYLNLEGRNITGNPYQDIYQTLNQTEEIKL